MKKSSWFILICIVAILFGCKGYKDRDTSESKECVLEFENTDSMLRDWPFPGANGNYIPSRDGLENCDTVVDGFPYNHV